MKKLYCIFGTAVVIVCATVIYMKPFHGPTVDSSAADLLMANVEALAEDEGGDSNVIKDERVKKNVIVRIEHETDFTTGKTKTIIIRDKKEISCCGYKKGAICDFRLHNPEC